MDESWRTHNLRRPRRSTEDTNRSNLDPNDFDDVFGGPPRSVISRQYSVEGDFARSISLEDIFRRKKPPVNCDRTLPEFRIPASGGRRSSNDDEEFYSDIFGSNNSGSLNKSRSKSNSSSILSSEDLISPFRPPIIDDDVSFSSFASKLRPINVSSKWNTSEKMHEMADKQPNSPCKCHSSESDYIHKFKGCYAGSSKKASSPEIINFGPNSYSSVRESMEDLQVHSPASMVSSLNQEQEDEASTIYDEEEDEVMSSYIIEINPSNRERVSETLCVDEAIAWAKQKCQTRDPDIKMNKTEDVEHACPDVEYVCPAVKEMPSVSKVPGVHVARHGSKDSPSLNQQKEITTEELLQELNNDESPCKQMELELLDEDIKLWSDGKEPNIRLLLSTLHHILWPSSGWIMIPLSNLKDSSSVKKAYQKARLCLHPDKLQQRGATIPQKYVAEKAFPILQDAWAAFITQDVRSSLT
uniref:J domain-containing protein required for chloroplast accumulation response 1 n=1 Tax=Erigeron canadensis TaxID=72917 RepID=UPI001CB9BB87|nr:J domain-containing protein required for chloroplast accumulation response 1 [Erigeron canadensis]